MSDQRFEKSIGSMADYWHTLQNCEKFEVATFNMPRAQSGVYAFYENDRPVYCGRSRDIRSRLQQHTHNNPYGATFAVKLARVAANRPATYKKGNSAKTLIKNDEKFKAEFDRARENIKKVDCRWVEIQNDLDQYLFEVYATLKLGLSSNLFRSH